MNSESVDTEPSLQMHKLPSVPFFRRGGGGQSTLFLGGGGLGYTLRKDNTVCRPLTNTHNPERATIIDLIPCSILIIAFLFLCMPATAPQYKLN